MVIKTILIFLIALLGYSEWLTGTSYLQRPIVLGPLVGLVMGDMVTGTIMGATMELAMVGAISVGAYNPPDTISGTILGVSLAMQAGADASAALTLGIPIATIVLALDTALGQPVMLLLVHRIDKNVEDGDTKAITRNMLIAGYAQSWCGLLIIPLAFFFGADAVASLLNIIPDFVQTGMDVAAAFLPALGFAMLAQMIMNKTVAPFFFAGFFLVAYFGISTTGVAIFAAIIVVAMTVLGDKKKRSSPQRQPRILRLGVGSMSFKFESSYDGLISRADLKKLFWRSIPYEHSWNYERMGHIGFMWALMPILRKLYPQDADFKAALKRHMELYNVTPYISTLPMSIAAAMEEVNATDDSFDTSAISNVKLALMGPLSGVGDAFYWGTLRILATGVGTSLALQGSILGPILFLLVFNVPHYIIRYLLTFVGYRFGSDMISKVQESGIMDTIVKMASIMGAMVIGAMTMEMVTVDIPLMVGAGDGAQTLAELLNGIFPGFVTMGLFGIVYLMLKKKMNPLLIMLVILLVSIAGAFFGVLGVQ